MLYAPTFSVSCTSTFDMNKGLLDLVSKKNVLVLVKLHDKISQELKNQYKKLAEEKTNILYIDDANILKYFNCFRCYDK